MNADCRIRLWSLLAEHADGGPVTVAYVCTAVPSAAGVDHAAVTVTLPASPRETLHATDQIAAEVEELTLTLGEGPGSMPLSGGPVLAAERCVQLLGISAAGLLLTDGQDTLQLVAASSERTRLLELFQLQTHQGPCVDCFRTGRPVSVADLPTAGRWPRFTAAAAEVGFAAVHALPMRLRSQVIGALNFFGTSPGTLDEGKPRIGQALADVATHRTAAATRHPPQRRPHRTAADRAEQPGPDRTGQRHPGRMPAPRRRRRVHRAA
jgi:hypothetical protein